MIHSSTFELDSQQKEIIESYTDTFPYVCLDVSLDYIIGRTWHWHPAFEVDYVLEGSMELQTSEDTIHLQKGDAIFINSNVMHKARASLSNRSCRIYAHLFSGIFLAGMYGNLLEQEFLSPISSSQSLSAFAIRPDTPAGIRMISQLLKAVEYNQIEAFGYQFEIRAALCRFWCALLENTKELRASGSIQSQRYLEDSERLKKMIDFIHENYPEPITVTDIARAANISARECSRCFQRSLKQTPASFLIQYRVTIASRMLIHTNRNILQISEACGFTSSSYFSKVFHEINQCTPSEFRKNNLI